MSDSSQKERLFFIKYTELPYFRLHVTDFAVIYTMNDCHWCAQCLPMIYAALAGPGIPVLVIVYNKDTTVAVGENLLGFPTLRRYQGQQMMEFKGDRTKENFIQFLA